MGWHTSAEQDTCMPWFQVGPIISLACDRDKNGEYTRRRDFVAVPTREFESPRLHCFQCQQAAILWRPAVVEALLPWFLPPLNGPTTHFPDALYQALCEVLSQPRAITIEQAKWRPLENDNDFDLVATVSWREHRVHSKHNSSRFVRRHIVFFMRPQSGLPSFQVNPIGGVFGGLPVENCAHDWFRFT